MLSLILDHHIYPVALRYWVELWSITMNAMNLSLAILGASYFLALVERFTKPEIIGNDGESEGLDQYYEQQYRDYTIAADRGYIGDF